MKFVCFVAGLPLALLAAPALAQQDDAGSKSLIGKVETVYVREARGLYFEKKLVRRTEGKELWAEIRLPQPSGGGSSSELARLPTDVAIETGDLVETEIVDPMPRNRALFEVNQVTKVVAKHNTLPAMLFGLSNPRPIPGFHAEALACIPACTRVAIASPGLGQETTVDNR
jgi:hypothetical protein